MPKLSLEIDEDAFERLARLSRRQNVSVEDFLLRNAMSAIAGETSVNPSHRSKEAAAARSEQDYESKREWVHDREYGRAEAYLRARAHLLRLVDNPEGDLGPEGWNRARLYEP
jgi:hypothetical protein